MDKKKNLELKKHVATIHSSNKLSLVQRKITNALLYNAYDELLEKEEHTIHIATLCKLIGYDSNDHKAIRKALVDLLSTVLEWNIIDGNRLTENDAGVWNASSIIADASLDGPLCTYSYSNKMKHLLYRPELYGRLNMAIQARFKSSYGLALYENCIRYQDIGQTPSFEILVFRKLMGVEESKYKIFRDFKSRVLDKAVQEVNTYSAIKVTPQLRKQGRQVVAVQFLITSNKKIAQDISESMNVAEILKSRFGFSKRQITEVLLNHAEEYILEKMAIVESSPAFQAGKIHNLAKYLLAAIKEDYQSIKNRPVLSIQQQKVSQNDITKEHKKIIHKIKKSYAEYREKSIDQVIATLAETERQKLMEQFFKNMTASINTIIRLQPNKYTLKNITESPQIKALLRNFAAQVLPKKFTRDIKPIEKFIEKLPEFEQQIWQTRV